MEEKERGREGERGKRREAISPRRCITNGDGTGAVFLGPLTVHPIIIPWHIRATAELGVVFLEDKC